ncbi:MAG: TetR/AcrR family transcriptional regulator [Deltaproteobacteria bacterium]|nr:TetR/AcrR family transcriptional regulator [Deltaproteobacteria bacterium]
MEKKQKGATNTREAIVDKAIRIIDKKGLSSFQLLDVAEAMGMKTPSLYNHFDGLDDLIRGVQVRTNELLYAFMAQASAGLHGRDAFRALGHAYRKFFKKHRGIYETMTIPIGLRDKELLDATLKPVELVTKILSSVRMDADFGVHVMRFIRCALHGFVSLEAKGNMVLKTSADESFDFMIEMLMESIWKTA